MSAAEGRLQALPAGVGGQGEDAAAADGEDGRYVQNGRGEAEGKRASRAHFLKNVRPISLIHLGREVARAKRITRSKGEI